MVHINSYEGEFIFSQSYHHTLGHINTYQVENYFLTKISPHSGAYKYSRSETLIFSEIYHRTVVHTNTYVIDNLVSHKYFATQGWFLKIHHHTVAQINTYEALGSFPLYDP